MNQLSATAQRMPAPADVLALLKPITWFPPMWAFFCGVVSSGVPVPERWPYLLLGVVLAGPLVCGTSQAVNDWFDRHVDAINEPDRPIPSGRIPGRWGLWIAIIGTAASLAVAPLLGIWVVVPTLVGLALAWAYSAPPFRLKKSGIWGPLSCGFAYEGLTWFTGAAVMLAALPSAPIIAMATLYALGAFGIMTMNDFKAVDGDRQMGIASLPVRIGVRPAAMVACIAMIVPQLLVIALLWQWDRSWFALAIAASVLGQCGLMVRLMSDPRKYTPWFNATGTTLYVLGMLVTAFGIRGVEGGIF